MVFCYSSMNKDTTLESLKSGFLSLAPSIKIALVKVPGDLSVAKSRAQFSVLIWPHQQHSTELRAIFYLKLILYLALRAMSLPWLCSSFSGVSHSSLWLWARWSTISVCLELSRRSRVLETLSPGQSRTVGHSTSEGWSVPELSPCTSRLTTFMISPNLMAISWWFPQIPVSPNVTPPHPSFPIAVNGSRLFPVVQTPKLGILLHSSLSLLPYLFIPPSKYIQNGSLLPHLLCCHIGLNYHCFFLYYCSGFLKPISFLPNFPYLPNQLFSTK